MVLPASLCAKIMVFRRITRIIGIVLNERAVIFRFVLSSFQRLPILINHLEVHLSIVKFQACGGIIALLQNREGIAIGIPVVEEETVRMSRNGQIHIRIIQNRKELADGVF